MRNAHEACRLGAEQCPHRVGLDDRRRDRVDAHTTRRELHREVAHKAFGKRLGDGDAYEAPGKLTIRGAAKDVVLPFTLTISGDQAAAKGHLSLMRSDFGIGQGPWSSGQWVALAVGVDVDLVATKSGS